MNGNNINKYRNLINNEKKFNNDNIEGNGKME